jgi:dihydrofolate reductase
MSRAVFDISMSLDGFITGPDQTPRALHDWADGDLEGRSGIAVPDTWRPDVFGAVICGRRTYEDSLPSWGADGPSLSRRLPVVVVAHDGGTQPPANGVYTFANGVEDALAQAQGLAGGKDITVMGGASVPQAFLRAGLLDEIKIHLVPVILGGGTRLFDNLDSESVRLRPIEVEQDDQATHLRYQVVTESGDRP